MIDEMELNMLKNVDKKSMYLVWVDASMLYIYLNVPR